MLTKKSQNVTNLLPKLIEIKLVKNNLKLKYLGI